MGLETGWNCHISLREGHLAEDRSSSATVSERNAESLCDTQDDIYVAGQDGDEKRVSWWGVQSDNSPKKGNCGLLILEVNKQNKGLCCTIAHSSYWKKHVTALAVPFKIIEYTNIPNIDGITVWPAETSLHRFVSLEHQPLSLRFIHFVKKLCCIGRQSETQVFDNLKVISN